MKQVWADAYHKYAEYIKEKGIEYEKWDDRDEQGGIGDLKRVIRLIKDYKEQDGVVIGTLGDWGTGKTSILKGIEYYFKKQKYPVLFFEAWKYHTEENPIIPLLQKLVEMIPTEKRQEVEKVLKIAALVGTDILLQSLTKGSLSISKIKKHQENLTDAVLERISFYDKLHEEIEKSISSLLGRKKKFILIVDDLDRCLPKAAVNLLEKLRFYFQVKDTIIILGLYEKIIAKYLEDVYWRKSGKSLLDGTQFLRKIFDWHIELSRTSPDRVIDYFFKGEDVEIKSAFRALDPLSYRMWKKVANRYFSLKQELPKNKKYAIFEAVVIECFPEMDISLRNYPEIRDFILRGLKAGEFPRQDPTISEFLTQSDESLWGKKGKEVIERVIKAVT